MDLAARDADLVRLARSEAEASHRLAATMHEQGNPMATAEHFEAGVIVSLGPGRFVNRALCTERAMTEDAIVHVVDFFRTRALPPSIQVPGWIDASDDLLKHGFTPDWTRSVLAAPTAVAASTMSPTRSSIPEVEFVAVTGASLDVWLGVLAEGNESPASVRPISDEFGIAAHAVQDSNDVLAYVDGDAVACGSLQVVDGIAWLGGAATLPSSRTHGVQTALLRHRIKHAVECDATWIAATARPNSTSERNLERAGLSRVDTQTVWTHTG